MGTDETRGDGASTGCIALARAYRVLDRQRLAIDQRIADLVPDDPAMTEAWQALDAALVELRQAVRALADTPAADMTELKAKSVILAELLRSDVGGGGQVIPEPDRTVLALSVTDDIDRLAGGE